MATAARRAKRLPTVEGNARTLLERERVALNFLQRLSGVATLARQYADAVAGTNCRVLDTRKTTPGMRALEKRAAAAGGVTNHRMGLFDAILIKNNHIAAAGGSPQRRAIEHTRHRKSQSPGPWPDRNRSRAPLEAELSTKPSTPARAHLLLDNLTPAEAADWVREIAGRAKVELSGGITLETVRAYAETGADFVSAGAITHSARAVDISFRLELHMNARRSFAAPSRTAASITTPPSIPPCAPPPACRAGAIVLAGEQTAGQGRHGHTWHSEPGAGSTAPSCSIPRPLLTLALGLAAVEAITEVTGLVCDLRWPNDLMLGGRKTAGILVQLVDGLAIAGIGINVNHAAFPPELAAEATSLRLAAGREMVARRRS